MSWISRDIHISIKIIALFIALAVLPISVGIIPFSFLWGKERVMAVIGNTNEQYRLGVMYSMGIDVGKDQTKALKWLSLAGASGHAPAAYLTGLMYSEGRGTAQNHKEAVKWYRIAAENDFVPAQAALGKIYTNGIGVEKNVEEGINWKTKAAESGNTSAIYDMGLMYYKGEFVERDEGEAIRWFNAGAKIGDYRSQYHLGIIKFRDGYIDDAISLISHAADKNYPDALLDLGIIYLTGQGVKKDYDTAYSLFMKASELNSAEAAYCAGMMNFLGTGMPENRQRALEFMEKASLRGFRDGQYIYGIILRDGIPGILKTEGNNKNIKKASEAFRKAGEQGLPEGTREYGRCLYKLADTDDKRQKAIEQIKKASRKLDPDAFVLLGSITEEKQEKQLTGKHKEAIEYYKNASMLGSAEASFILGQKYEIGDSVKQDMHEAVFFYERAIEQAREETRAVISSPFSAEGKKEGIMRPVWMYERPAGYKHGAMAEYALGMMYCWGKGMPADKKRGMELINSAVEKGYKEF